jgi:UDP-3-O-[3-hydroxymyristoyl] glucosamine N-acyltransferase
MPQYTLEELAQILNGSASESPGPSISGARPLEFSEPEDITFVTSPKFLKKLDESSAGAVLLPPDLQYTSKPFITVGNPEASFARLTALFYPHPRIYEGVSEQAFVHPDVELGIGVSVGPFAVVEAGARIGDGVIVGSHTVVGKGCIIGRDSRLFPHVTIYPDVKIGCRVSIHAGTVIGADGFGYAPDMTEDGHPVAVKKYHSGNVVIEDDVEIGALCAVDRALAGTTRLGKGVKIDNLVQIAHNVEIGEGTVIASQAGIAGSSSIGSFGVVGGQAGIRDHIKVGNGVMLAAQVGVYRNIPDGSIMSGSVPAMPHKLFGRVQSAFKRLPEILDRVRRLEKLVQSQDKDT